MPESLDKASLRQSLLGRRMTLSISEQKEASDKIRDRFLTSNLVQKEKIIAGYCPVRGEADVTPLIRRLRAEYFQTALPRVNGQDIDFILVTETTPIDKGSFSIPEPQTGVQVIPDIALIPLLGFDRYGHRLGYGKGYYDRFLSQPEAAHVQRIGIAYDWQETPSLPAAPHDVRLHAIITDKRLIRFEKE